MSLRLVQLLLSMFRTQLPLGLPILGWPITDESSDNDQRAGRGSVPFHRVPSVVSSPFIAFIIL